MDNFPQDAIERQQSRHRLVLAVKQLGSLGALYSVVIASRRQKNEKPDSDEPRGGFFYAPGPQNEGRLLLRLKAEVEQVRQDRCVVPEFGKVGQLADNLEKLKALFAVEKPGKNQQASFPTSGPRIAG